MGRPKDLEVSVDILATAISDEGIVFVSTTLITSTSGIPYSAVDTVKVFVEFGSGTPFARYQINGGAVGTLTWPVSSHGAVPSSSTAVDLFQDRGAAVLSAWHQRVRAYVPGRRPAWAA